MRIALRYLYLLALVVWLGGMVVLGAIVAPTVFQVLQAADPANGRVLAGQFFGEAIARFHVVAYVAGGVMVATLVALRAVGARPAGFAFRMLIIAAMLAVSVYSGLVVLGRIDVIQQQVGTLPSRLPVGDPRRVEFDALHVLATRLMQANMVGALVLLAFEARERTA